MAATVWKGFISFGLVSFPVRLFAAARPRGIHFHMLHKKDLSRIKEVLYCAEEDKPVSREDIVKGTEVNKGQYVVVTDQELKAVAPPTASTMDILQFVPASAVDPLYLESSYYVAPEEAVAKPYALLLDAMAETKYFALAKITMHGREHIAVMRPASSGLVLHTLYFENELQKTNAPEFPRKRAYSAKEMELAKTLVNQLAGKFEPEKYHDEYVANVERLLEQKQRGEKITAVRAPKRRPVVNIMEALQKSLAESRTRPAKAAKAKKSRKAA
ncbi:MAG TPA: Ku protein [Bryobacteraceae bacterium]|nr:Ku protein [Bryobacteraceae bacterium]